MEMLLGEIRNLLSNASREPSFVKTPQVSDAAKTQKRELNDKIENQNRMRYLTISSLLLLFIFHCVCFCDE